MKKQIAILLILTVLFSLSTIAQKKPSSFGISAGTSIVLSNTQLKPGIHAGLSITVPTKKETGEVVVGLDYNNFYSKLVSGAHADYADIKVGYRFFPAKETPFYLQPAIGVAVNTAPFSPTLAVVMDIGYLPKAGTGKVNVFGRYNHLGAGNGLSFVNFGLGYQFGKK